MSSRASVSSSGGGAGAGAGKPAGMTRKDVTCDYCDRLIRDCMCVTAPTHGRYCDTCGRARQFCICLQGYCSYGCMKPEAECACDICRTCKMKRDACVCICNACKSKTCHCYEGYEEEERDPDECPRCYSNPCECEKIACQKDRNRMADFNCTDCGLHYKRCQCGRPEADD